jgi:sulfur carrier protein
MKIVLNNRDEVVDKETVTLTEFLILKKFSFRMRIVKINGTFIPKDEYDKTLIKDGDNVQMLYLMSGG